MMSKLWNKGGTDALHPLIEDYTVGDDATLDHQLLLFDVVASSVHAQGLHKIGILTEMECEQLLAKLEEIADLHQQGQFEITVQDEDCHTAIEGYLVRELGDVGKKIHTGRSRNDQVLVALRLYMLNHINLILVKGLDLAEALLQAARGYENIPLPGYTHTQQAMMSSVGHLYAAYLESLLDDLDLMQMVAEYLDKNPLGSAAGYGVSIDLDRQLTTELLGFNAVQVNSIYCQNSRGKFEGFFLEGLQQIMMTLGRIASDLILYTSQEFNFFSVDQSLVTGSSIMPQKRNLDGLEILRGQAKVVAQNSQWIHSIPQGLISGYHRDTQLMKKPLMESTITTIQSLDVATLYIKGAEPIKENIEAKISSGIYAADVANRLVKEEGMPFREAYQKAMDLLETDVMSPVENIKSKVSLGAPGNLGLEIYEQRIQHFRDLADALDTSQEGDEGDT